jgi:glycosyltransferase involved in cell wall biosynthesis
MRNLPTITAVIPTYNRRLQLLAAVDSVLAQTVSVDQIIVVDDGSTDGTAGAIRTRYRDHVEVCTQENAGVAAARNRGIRAATGDWVAFLDSDDLWLPTKIERQLAALAASGEGLGVCFTDFKFTGDESRVLSGFEEVGRTDLPMIGVLQDPTWEVITRSGYLWIQTFLVRRSLLGQIGGFDEGLTIREDTDLTFRLSFATGFCFVRERLTLVDRAPSRRHGLDKLLGTRDDRSYDSFERLFAGWLALPEVRGSKYEQPIRELLRETYYSSLEAKAHDLRLGPALRRLGRLRAMGEDYASIARTLFARKASKVLRRTKAREQPV